jgi:hypothetical protein
VVLLVHAVVPHHHHSENQVAFSFWCSQDVEHSHHESVPICHEEHEEHEYETCRIAQKLILLNNRFRIDEKSAEFESSQILLNNALIVYNFSTQDNFSADLYRIAENIPIFTKFLITSQGLRAPPVC